jgi:hypothetical protein
MRHKSGSFYLYSKTNVIHFLLNLLRINDLYMFQALFGHPQEVLHKRNFVYCVRVLSAGLIRIGVERSSTPIQLPTDITRMQYTKCRLWSASRG